MKLPSVYIECSEEQAKLNDALAKAQATFGPVVKDEKGPFGMFASLNSMITATRPALAANGLAVVQAPQPISDNYGKCYCVTELRHSSGQWLRSACEVWVYENSQKTMASFSYMRRMAYGGVLCLASCSDNDGEGLGGDGKLVALIRSSIKQSSTVPQLEKIIKRLGEVSKSGELEHEQAAELVQEAVDRQHSLKKKKEPSDAK